MEKSFLNFKVHILVLFTPTVVAYHPFRYFRQQIQIGIPQILPDPST